MRVRNESRRARLDERQRGRRWVRAQISPAWWSKTNGCSGWNWRKNLAAAGWQVLEAASGEEALGSAGQGASRIDFLVTDIRLPRRGGWLGGGGSRAASYPGVPVIYVSANPIDEERAGGGQHLSGQAGRYPLRKPATGWCGATAA